MGKTCLIVVDVQNDFVSGSLAVPDGQQVIPRIADYVDEADIVVFTRDYHVPDHPSFAKGQPEYVDGSWPPHCVQGTYGVGIDEWLWNKAEESGKPVYVVSKGQTEESYSGFGGTTDEGESLERVLIDNEVDEVWIAGLALDYCVLNTALDAVRSGEDFKTFVLLGATRPVAYESGAKAIAQLADEGVCFE